MSSNSWKTLGNVSNTNNLNNVGFDSVVSNNIIVKNNASINGKLTVNYLEVFQDTSFNGQVYISSGTTQIGDVNMNSRLFVLGDVSMGSRLFVTGDVSMGSRLYVRGDVSMGSRLYVVGDASFGSSLLVAGDVSLGSRLFVRGDVSMGSRLFIIGDVSIGGSFYVGGSRLFVAGDASLGSRLFVRGDASLGSRLFVAGDASFGSSLLVAGDVSLGSRLFVRGDVSMGSRLFVIGDVSFNGNLAVNSIIYNQQSIVNGVIISPLLTVSGQLFVIQDVSIGGTLYVRGSSNFVGDASFASRVIVAGDASLGSRLLVAGDVSMGSRLYVRGDVSMGSRLYVVGDASISSRLFVAGDVSIGGSLYVAGNTRFPIPLGNVALVDASNGNDSTASVGGRSYLTVAAALAAVTSGQTVWVLPGTYNLASGITIPNGVALRGINTQTVIIQMLSVTANTTLLTMGENSRVEDITFKLTSSGHYTLTGIEFGGTTSTTAKLRTCVLTVDNNGASSGGTSNVTGVLCSGTGSLGSFSFNSLKGSTVNVYSNGAGNKRGVLVTGSNTITTRDFNIYVAQPTSTASTGSYVGVEVNDSANTGSIQMRSTTIGTVTPIAGQSYTASDILQTTPATITNPTYLASAGIQIGPGTDLVTKSAGSKGFSTYVYPTIIFYGLKGSVGNINAGYLWPGSQEPKNNVFPDITTPAAGFRIQQPTILSGLSVALNSAPTGTGNARYVTLLARYTPISTGVVTDTSFTVTVANSDLSGAYYNSSKSLNTGDKIHLYFSCVGGASNTATDLTAQLDMF